MAEFLSEETNAGTGSAPSSNDTAPEATGSSKTANNGGDSSQANIYHPNSNTIDFSGISETTPFNARTEEVRKEVVLNTVFADAYYGAVKSSLITNNNLYYRLRSGGSPGYIHDTTAITHRSIKSNNPGWWGRNVLAQNCVLPNCVGAARGRYQEIIGLDENGNPYKSLGDDSPPQWLTSNEFAFKNSKSFKSSNDIPADQKDNYVKLYNNFYLWKDTAGTYGIKDGLWGCIKADKDTPVLPGCFLVWDRVGSPGSGHIEFVEAVYNFGLSNEYVVTTNSWYAYYNHFLVCERLDRNNSYGSEPYCYGNPYRNTKILYSPLCNYSGSVGIGGAIPQIDIQHVPADPEDIKRYNEALDSLNKTSIELKVGDKVKIQNIGNQKPDGSGKGVNKNLMTGWVKKIHASGTKFRYEVMDRQNNGALIGCFTRSALALQ